MMENRANSVARFLMKVDFDLRARESIMEYTYVKPKKSMRGENSVCSCEVERNNVAKAE